MGTCMVRRSNDIDYSRRAAAPGLRVQSEEQPVVVARRGAARTATWTVPTRRHGIVELDVLSRQQRPRDRRRRARDANVDAKLGVDALRAAALRRLQLGGGAPQLKRLAEEPLVPGGWSNAAEPSAWAASGLRMQPQETVVPRCCGVAPPSDHRRPRRPAAVAPPRRPLLLTKPRVLDAQLHLLRRDRDRVRPSQRVLDGQDRRAPELPRVLRRVDPLRERRPHGGLVDDAAKAEGQPRAWRRDGAPLLGGRAEQLVVAASVWADAATPVSLVEGQLRAFGCSRRLRRRPAVAKEALMAASCGLTKTAAALTVPRCGFESISHVAQLSSAVSAALVRRIATGGTCSRVTTRGCSSTSSRLARKTDRLRSISPSMRSGAWMCGWRSDAANMATWAASGSRDAASRWDLRRRIASHACGGQPQASRCSPNEHGGQLWPR